MDVPSLKLLGNELTSTSGSTMFSSLEKPLPKENLKELAKLKLKEALIESKLALEYLEKGIVRNAAGKAFQAWKALISALIASNFNKLSKDLDEEQRKWLREKGILALTTKLKYLSQMLEEKTGLNGISFGTDKALDLHDYQYNGPDPDLVYSKYADPEEAKEDVKLLIKALLEYIERYKDLLDEEGAKVLEEVEGSLES